MKLLLILLVPVLCFAQYPSSQSLPDAYMLGDTSKHITFVEGPATGITYRYGLPEDSIVFDLYRDIFLPRLLADWEAYKVECDSIFLYNDGYEYERMTVTKYRKTLAGWLDTTPFDECGHWIQEVPTFPGFMQYLTTRLERKENK
jgi:hypothetical protein